MCFFYLFYLILFIKFLFLYQQIWCLGGKKGELFRLPFFAPVRRKKKSQKPNLSRIIISIVLCIFSQDSPWPIPSQELLYQKTKSFKKLFCALGIMKLIDGSQKEIICWFRPDLAAEMLVSWYTKTDSLYVNRIQTRTPIFKQCIY